MNLEQLLPEEKDKLLEKLIEERKSGFSGDVSALTDAVEYMMQRIELLEKVVMDELIGGIEELYKGNLRKSRRSEIEEMYGQDLEQFKGPYSAMWDDDRDLIEDLLDQIDELENGWEDPENPFDRGGMTSQMIEKLKEKMSKIMGMPGVEAASVQVDPEEAAEAMDGERSEEDDLLEQVKRLSKRNKDY